jgi:hypothetical protein
MAAINAVLRHCIKICNVDIVKILDKFSWITVLFLQLCDREAASHAREEMMQQSLQTFVLP